MSALVSKLRRAAQRVAETFPGRPAQDHGFADWEAGFDAGCAMSRVAAQSRAEERDAGLDCNRDVPPGDLAAKVKEWHDLHESPPRDVAGRPIEAAEAVGSPGHIPPEDPAPVFATPDLHAATSAEVEARIAKAYREGQRDARKVSAVQVAAIDRLGLLAELSGSLSRTIGASLKSRSVAHMPAGFVLREDLDRQIDRIHAAAVVLRQAGDLPAIDIERRAQLVAEYRAELGLDAVDEEGAL